MMHLLTSAVFLGIGYLIGNSRKAKAVGKVHLAGQKATAQAYSNGLLEGLKMGAESAEYHYKPKRDAHGHFVKRDSMQDMMWPAPHPSQFVRPIDSK